jgi:hypothetical protein
MQNIHISNICIHVHMYLRKIIPILEIVAGEAHDKSCDSNRKFTLGPNWILSPDGIVKSLRISR